MKKQHNYTVMHWGTWQVESSEGEIVAVKPVPWDKNPSRIGQSLPDAVTSQTRIRRPAVRAGYLQHGPVSREGRGKEPFVEVSWEVALDLLARELRSVKARCGNEAIYGGSYGWASAGRFHHAQSQLHRFLKGFGGYTASTNTYSSAAGERILPHILGPLSPLHRQHTHFSELARECQLFVAIGGLPLRNAQVNGGGANDHMLQYWLDKMQANGTRFINISPVRNDLSAVPDAEWLAIRPGTDTALLLALSYVLIAESLYDQGVCCQPYRRVCPLSRLSVGRARWRGENPSVGGGDYRPGRPAHRRSGAGDGPPPDDGEYLLVYPARPSREQAYWATVALTALLGQLGTPGGGLGFGYACTNLAGAVRKAFSGPRLPAGENAVDSVIPVARLSDMLLHPGETYEFDGQQRRYPDIRLVYWAGGNAFHHHQDINRLCEAWRRPETVVVHEQYWTAQAKFSDIVLPATTSLEREDIGSGGHDGFMIAMSAQIPPVGEARDDYAIFCDLAGRLGFGEAFSEGRDAGQWLRHLYEESRPRAQEEGIALPSFDDFWQQGVLEYCAPGGRKFFSPIFAPIRSAIRSPPLRQN
ncbi:molybdopterin-dependent oxidoreductase [Klebsiella pneumoniae]